MTLQSIQSEMSMKACLITYTDYEIGVYLGSDQRANCGLVDVVTTVYREDDQVYTSVCRAIGDTIILRKSQNKISFSEIIIITGSILG